MGSAFADARIPLIRTRPGYSTPESGLFLVITAHNTNIKIRGPSANRPRFEPPFLTINILRSARKFSQHPSHGIPLRRLISYVARHDLPLVVFLPACWLFRSFFSAHRPPTENYGVSH